ncbi:unnamed protein product [Spirodela intermedia]|uniref:Uncharacterized protein n=1 Tax=Spirodela intermedia TaxID=51605 RepID=A0A7I8L0X5_SPIIN|nr:unnamed protein product [Spirodela intermedia]
MQVLLYIIITALFILMPNFFQNNYIKYISINHKILAQ